MFAFVLRLEDARGLARLHHPDLHAFVVNREQIPTDEVKVESPLLSLSVSLGIEGDQRRISIQRSNAKRTNL